MATNIAEDSADFARLRLLRTGGVGPITWRQLMSRFGSAAAAIDALPTLAKRGGAKRFALAPAEQVAEEIEAVERLGGRYIFLDTAAYPPLLAESEGAPAALIIKGDIALAEQTCVAIVGARNASAIGRRFARELAMQLAAQNIVVASGLAQGIDTAAHVGAMQRGQTIAVIASGIDSAFPTENTDLQDEIAAQHLLISELPPGAVSRAQHFPSRNRIIAGLSVATVVIEAAPKSGSLITARRAGDFGREVLAVPGSPFDPRAQGCNQLIRDGATLIQNAEDVLEAIRPISTQMQAVPVQERLRIPPSAEAKQEAHTIAETAKPYSSASAPSPSSASDDTDSTLGESDRERLIALLSPVAVEVDELIRQSGLSAAAVQLVLLELELAGRLRRHPGAHVSLANT